MKKNAVIPAWMPEPVKYEVLSMREDKGEY
jgi:hypothetical protein